MLRRAVYCWKSISQLITNPAGCDPEHHMALYRCFFFPQMDSSRKKRNSKELGIKPGKRIGSPWARRGISRGERRKMLWPPELERRNALGDLSGVPGDASSLMLSETTVTLSRVRPNERPCDSAWGSIHSAFPSIFQKLHRLFKL